MNETDYKKAEAELRTIAAKAFQDLPVESGDTGEPQSASPNRLSVTGKQSDEAKAARDDLEQRALARFAVAR